MAKAPTVQERLKHLEGEVERLRSEVARLTEEPEAVNIREISREDAKSEILQLFRTGRSLFYSDIMRELAIDIDLVVEVCEELESEGKIGVVGDDTKRQGRSTRGRKNIRRSSKDTKVRSG
jgi:hypothetical protein